jgi:hypothetical protein
VYNRSLYSGGGRAHNESHRSLRCAGSVLLTHWELSQ